MLGSKLIQFTWIPDDGAFCRQYTEAEPLCVGIHAYIVNLFEMNCKHIMMTDLTWWCIFIHPVAIPSTGGKRAPLTATSLHAVGSPKEAPHVFIAKVWSLIKLRNKNVFFSQNNTKIKSDCWTITKKTTRTIKHDNFSKVKNLRVDRWVI